MEPLHSILPVSPSPAGAASRRVFADLLRPARAPALEVSHALTAPAPVVRAPVLQALERVRAAQARMDVVLRLAASGRSFRPAELLALQAAVSRESQVVDLSGRLVERATAAVRQVLQTPV